MSFACRLRAERDYAFDPRVAIATSLLAESRTDHVVLASGVGARSYRYTSRLQCRQTNCDPFFTARPPSCIESTVETQVIVMMLSKAYPSAIVGARPDISFNPIFVQAAQGSRIKPTVKECDDAVQLDEMKPLPQFRLPNNFWKRFRSLLRIRYYENSKVDRPSLLLRLSQCRRKLS